jgi:hypothetical protein
VTTLGANVSLGTTTVSARLYLAPAGSSTYTAVGNDVTLSPGVALLSIGQLMEGSQQENIAVHEGDRLLVAFYASNDGGILSVAGAVIGNASAGVTIC